MSTTLFYHYKNKPYKYLGLAKHSETLEDLVVYETRYENDLATLWVRPKDIFESTIEVAGQIIPRFRKSSLQIKEHSMITPDTLEILSTLNQKIFGTWDSSHFKSKIKANPRFQILLALIDDKVAGFKLGYELSPEVFYSWVGGVLPEYQGVGIAGELMKFQHEWCRKQGYQRIQTKTQNRFREMFILNLKHGFEVIGTEESPTKGLKIILEKRVT